MIRRRRLSRGRIRQWLLFDQHPFFVEIVLGVIEAISALVAAGFQKAVGPFRRQPFSVGGRR